MYFIIALFLQLICIPSCMHHIFTVHLSVEWYFHFLAVYCSRSRLKSHAIASFTQNIGQSSHMTLLVISRTNYMWQKAAYDKNMFFFPWILRKSSNGQLWWIFYLLHLGVTWNTFIHRLLWKKIQLPGKLWNFLIWTEFLVAKVYFSLIIS